MSGIRAPLSTPHTTFAGTPTGDPRDSDVRRTAHNARKYTRPQPQPSWDWPVPIDTYDRSPILSPREIAALAPLVGRSSADTPTAAVATAIDTDLIKLQLGMRPQRRGRDVRGGIALRRLLKPVEDVLAATHAGKTTKGTVITILLHGMYAKQMAYWGWTEDDWVALYQSSALLKSSGRLGNVRTARHHALVVAYLFGDVRHLHRFGQFHQRLLAARVFGTIPVTEAVDRVCTALQQWGYQAYRLRHVIPTAVCEALLANRSPCLEDLSGEVLESLGTQHDLPEYLRHGCAVLAHALVGLDIVQQPLPRFVRSAARFETRGVPRGEAWGVTDRDRDRDTANVPGEWLEWAQRWRMTSTHAPQTKRHVYSDLLKAGRWLAQHHPDVRTPRDWTRTLAADYVAAVDQTVVGQWVAGHSSRLAERLGQPFAAATKAGMLSHLRIFFRDCQEWGWIPRHFDAQRSFATPKSIRALIGPNPRTIADDVWAKLLWAGLNLTEEDLPHTLFGPQHRGRGSWYPLEMIRAITVVWLFCGLRSQEILRLRIGCIRWQRDDVRIPGTTEVLPKDAVCLLDVPVHKTGHAFTKPVDLVVGEAVSVWERLRPQQPAAIDPKTGEFVHVLFAYRGRCIGPSYINESLIPLLCRKAGMPANDARGDITSHRARSTIATQLFNAKEPLTLFELQEWLGHRSPASTQYYARIAPTRLAKSYEQAGYFGRNLRTIEVLVDREVVLSGAAANGAPWRYYDLGHGYCTYDFFEQCPHRMACAKCSFYRPKAASRDLLVEGHGNLVRMLQEIPLSDDERAAVEEGAAALAKLSEQLVDVPTPAGPTPRQLGQPRLENRRHLPVLPAQSFPSIPPPRASKERGP